MKSYFNEMSVTLNKTYETGWVRFTCSKTSNLLFVKLIYHLEWKRGNERDTDEVGTANGVLKATIFPSSVPGFVSNITFYLLADGY